MTRQKDFSTTVVGRRVLRSRTVLFEIAKRRHTLKYSSFISNSTLCFLSYRYVLLRSNFGNILQRRNRISLTDFWFNFNAYSDVDCLVYFRFRKQHLLRIVAVMGWAENKNWTKRNRYSATPLLAALYVVIRRLASPTRWRDLNLMFGKHGPQLSEIFWEALEHLLEARQHLITGEIDQHFMEQRMQEYARIVQDKCSALDNCVAFIDGTVLAIARPKGNLPQRVVYNGHKRKHALKYQVVNTPDGLILHVCGPIEGRRHDWTLYVKSNLDDTLPVLLEFEGKLYCIYGDSSYSWRWFLEVPFQGGNLTAAQKAFNKAMSSVRITVEWIFKEIKMQFATVDFKRKMKLL